jgi:hypothetical protein
MEEEDRPLTDQEVRVRTLYSGISSGTELTAFRGTHPKLRKRWDESRRLFIDDPQRETIAYPIVGWGYEEVGAAVEVGAAAQDSIPLGSTVYGSWVFSDTEKGRWRPLKVPVMRLAPCHS